MTLVSVRRIEQIKLVSSKKKKATPTRDPKTFRGRRISYDLEDPITHDRAVAEIVAALTETRGHAVNAAQALGVSHRALLDWVARTPEIETKLAAIRTLYDHPDQAHPERRRPPKA